MPALTKEVLVQLVSYDEITGQLVWVRPTGNKARAGNFMGTVNCVGYRQTTIYGKRYLVHHLVWLYHKGELPPKPMDIDHKDGDRANNRIENLRLVTRSQNLSGGAGRKNPVLPGVVKLPSGKFAAYIHIKRKRTYVGTYESAAEAHEAYKVRHIAEYGSSSKFHHEHPRLPTLII